MKDPEREKAVSNGLKEIVKHTSKRKGFGQSSKHRASDIAIAPKISDDSKKSPSSTTTSSGQDKITPSLQSGSSHGDSVPPHPDDEVTRSWPFFDWNDLTLA